MQKKLISIALISLALLTSCEPRYNLDYNYGRYVIERLDEGDNIFTDSSYFLISKDNNTGRELIDVSMGEERAYFLFYNLKDDISYIDFHHIANKTLAFICYDANDESTYYYFNLCSDDWSKGASRYKSATEFRRS